MSSTPPQNLPRRQLIWHDPRRLRHPAAPRALPRLRGDGTDGDPRQTDRILDEDTLTWARENGDGDLTAQLSEIGPPPYESILNYEPALSCEHEVYPYDHSGNSEGAGGFSDTLFVEEYTLLEQIHNLGAFLDTFTALYSQLQEIDFREQVARLEVPVYLVQGRHEARGRARRLRRRDVRGH